MITVIVNYLSCQHHRQAVLISFIKSFQPYRKKKVATCANGDCAAGGVSAPRQFGDVMIEQESIASWRICNPHESIYGAVRDADEYSHPAAGL